jgi:hypothetical protein
MKTSRPAKPGELLRATLSLQRHTGALYAIAIHPYLREDAGRRSYMMTTGRQIAAGAQPVVEAFSGALKVALGEDLRALIVSGEATRSDFVAGRSAIDSVLLLTTVDGAALGTIRAAWKPLARKGLQPPIVLLPQALLDSLDVFPVEFLSLRETGVVVAGEYILEELPIAVPDLRLQCERELRGLALHARLAAIRAGDDGRAIGDWLLGGSGKLDMLLVALEFLGTGGNLGPEGKRLVTIGEASKVDCSAFAVLHELRGQKRPRVEPAALFALEETLTALVQWVDGFGGASA